MTLAIVTYYCNLKLTVCSYNITSVTLGLCGLRSRFRNPGRPNLTQSYKLFVVNISTRHLSVVWFYEKRHGDQKVNTAGRHCFIQFIHKYINKKLPTIFDSYFILANTTHSRNTLFSIHQNFHIPLYKTKRTQFSIKFIVTKILELDSTKY